MTNEGPVVTWFDIARRTFELLETTATVSRTTTEDYGRDRNLAWRPRHSTLSLDKLKGTGFTPADADARLREYLTDFLEKD